MTGAPIDKESTQKREAELKKAIEKAKNNIKGIQDIMDYFKANNNFALVEIGRKYSELEKEEKDVIKKYEECLKKCPKTTAPSNATTGATTGEVIIELEETRHISGTNPFDPNQVEDKLTGGRSSGTASTSGTGTTGGTTGGGGTGGGGGGGGTPTPAVSTSDVSVTHIVGTTGCPTAFTPITVSASGSPVTITGVSTSGTGVSRLDVTLSGSGSASPTLNTSFNCSSNSPGSFSIIVTFTATVGGVATVLSYTATVTVTP